MPRNAQGKRSALAPGARVKVYRAFYKINSRAHILPTVTRAAVKVRCVEAAAVVFNQNNKFILVTRKLDVNSRRIRMLENISRPFLHDPVQRDFGKLIKAIGKFKYIQ